MKFDLAKAQIHEDKCSPNILPSRKNRNNSKTSVTTLSKAEEIKIL